MGQGVLDLNVAVVETVLFCLTVFLFVWLNSLNSNINWIITWNFYFRCANYPSVVYHPAPSINLQRFSLETAKLTGTDSFVFVHCHVILCNATDLDSQCAKKCPSGNRGKREVSDHEIDAAYYLAQGPLLLIHEKKEEKKSNGGASNELEMNSKYANFRIKGSQRNILNCTRN